MMICVSIYLQTSSLPTLTLTSSSDNQTIVPAAEVVEVVTVGGDELIKSSTSSSSVVGFLSKSIDACRYELSVFND